MESKVWVSFSWITFQPSCQEIAKYSCIASSFHNIFHFLHNKVCDETNTHTSWSHKVHKITRSNMFSWNCFEKHGFSCTRKLNFSSPALELSAQCHAVLLCATNASNSLNFKSFIMHSNHVFPGQPLGLLPVTIVLSTFLGPAYCKWYCLWLGMGW